MNTKGNQREPLKTGDVRPHMIITDATVLLEMIGTMFRTILENDMDYKKSEKEKIKPNDELLTMIETLNLLKVSKVTIHNWKKKGIIKSHKIGRKLFFKKEELLDAIKRQKYS
jgi:excisionase family DNA binding protein